MSSQNNKEPDQDNGDEIADSTVDFEDEDPEEREHLEQFESWMASMEDEPEEPEVDDEEDWRNSPEFLEEYLYSMGFGDKEVDWALEAEFGIKPGVHTRRLPNSPAIRDACDLKELRPRGGFLRFLFALVPRRVVILLLGGDKKGQWREW